MPFKAIHVSKVYPTMHRFWKRLSLFISYWNNYVITVWKNKWKQGKRKFKGLTGHATTPSPPHHKKPYLQPHRNKRHICPTSPPVLPPYPSMAFFPLFPWMPLSCRFHCIKKPPSPCNNCVFRKFKGLVGHLWCIQGNKTDVYHGKRGIVLIPYKQGRIKR